MVKLHITEFTKNFKELGYSEGNVSDGNDSVKVMSVWLNFI